MNGCEVAVLVPCFNEEITIAKVTQDFRAALPGAKIYVYDNNSTDETFRAALEAGAIVRREAWQGKGNVVRRMFADIDADIYVLVDGDDTYDAGAAPKLIDLLLRDQLDFVNGARESEEIAAYRRGHRFGNYVLTQLVRQIFGPRFRDML
ncbi:MAG TPA: glycosyltransferase family 2 protein, partial [Rhodoblastus sp.]|nr:glycosyltransferase family 2 protein [Rhodoblastus sp.]